MSLERQATCHIGDEAFGIIGAFLIMLTEILENLVYLCIRF